jgi:site-specific DNA-methyltransferase (adenine-specific)
MTLIPIEQINLSGGTQPRSTIDQDVLNDYRDALQAGAKFPPVVVFHDGTDYWLADGFHRVHAHVMRRAVDIDADVRQGTWRDAILYSVGANAAHGLRRTNDDKQRAVRKLLEDCEWSRWSDREIARRCGVDNSFVSRLRRTLTVDEQQSERTFVTKHGTVATMRTASIGKPVTLVPTVAEPIPVPQPAAPSSLVLGGATIYLGDCRDVLETLEPVSHILTDPPYEADAHRQGRVTNASINGGADATLAFDAITEDLRSYVSTQAKRLSEGWFVAFCQAEGVLPWRRAIENAEHRYRGPAVWTKPDASPKFAGNGPAPAFEMLVTSWCGAGDSKWNSRGKRGVYNHAVNTGRHGGHQTEKPLSLLRELLLDFTQPGDVILDPFMGIGSLGVACIELGRAYIGIEMDARYFDIACERLEAANGKGSLCDVANDNTPPESPLFGEFAEGNKPAFLKKKG